MGRHFEDGIIDSIFGCTTTPERVFVGVTHDGLYRTIDGGESWSKVLAGDIRSVTVDPTDDKVIYSDKPEQSWVRAENGLNRNYFHDFPFLPAMKSDEKATMILATADQSPDFWRRENRGARSFVQKRRRCRIMDAHYQRSCRRSRLHDLGSSASPGDHRSLFAGFGNVALGHASGSGGAGDLMVSRDMGESWQRLNIDLPADRLGGGGLISTACFSGSSSKRSSASPTLARRLDLTA